MASAKYRRNFGPDSVEELRNNITSTHEDFLREDDPDKKSDFLRYMCGYAMEYLHAVPHDKKFTFKETERVLHQSAMNISDFDPREASLAFEHLGKYAHNILNQPWRKDFHKILLISGPYVHNIRFSLTNAHEILVAMGYVHIDEHTLQAVPVMDEKRIKNVSKDMILASQECIVLSSIWQRVADQEPDYPLTIGEVFEFRKKYIGDTDSIVNTMLLDIRKRHHDEKMQRITKRLTGKNFVPVDKLIDIENEEDQENEKGKGRRTLGELELAQKVMLNTKLMHEKEEHIYDPVCPDTHSKSNGISSTFHNYKSPQYYPSSGSSTSAFVPLQKPVPQQYPQSRYPTSRDSPLSPLIPKTVSSFNNYGYGGYGNGLSTSSSLSSVNFDQRRQSNHLQLSKISPEEVAWNNANGSGSDNRSRTSTTNPRRKSEGQGGTTLNWSEFSSRTYADQQQQYQRRRFSERPGPVTSVDTVDGGRSRKPIMPSDIYPDDYFPRIIKPKAIHSRVQNGFSSNSNGYEHLEESGEDDMMNEALAYRSEVATTTSNHKDKDRSHSQSDSTSRMVKSEWETDISSATSFSKKSPSSDESSSWDLQEGTVQRPVRKTSGTQTQTNASGSGSSSKFPKTLPIMPSSPTKKSASSSNQDEESLQDIYFKQLLHNGHGQGQDDLHPDINSNTPSTTKVKVEKKIDPISSPKIPPWNCPHCTFKNKVQDKVCEVCSRTRDFVLSEDENEEFEMIPTPPPPPKLYSEQKATPKAGASSSENMISCVQCTLLNPKVRFECDACGYRLRNASSPKSFV